MQHDYIQVYLHKTKKFCPEQHDKRIGSASDLHAPKRPKRHGLVISLAECSWAGNQSQLSGANM